jgi:RNA polymerase sigma factor (sigma-70 family)
MRTGRGDAPAPGPAPGAGAGDDAAGRPEHGEAAALSAAIGRGRDADRDLATALDRPRPAGGFADEVYLDELIRRAPLSPDAERALIAAAKAGDERARGRLIEEYMPLVAGLARHYRASPSVARVELLQEGAVGLLEALQQYDPSRGTPFWAYAKPWVRRAMQRVIADIARPVALSDRSLRHLSRIRDAQLELAAELHREPTPQEIAERTHLPREHVEELLVVDRPPRSTAEELGGREGPAFGRFEDMLIDPRAEEDYERVLDEAEAEGMLSLLSVLSDREREVLGARHGIDGPEQTRAEIASRLGVSASRVKQIERRALAKLRAAARDAGVAA